MHLYQPVKAREPSLTDYDNKLTLAKYEKKDGVQDLNSYFPL